MQNTIGCFLKFRRGNRWNFREDKWRVQCWLRVVHSSRSFVICLADSRRHGKWNWSAIKFWQNYEIVKSFGSKEKLFCKNPNFSRISVRKTWNLRTKQWWRTALKLLIFSHRDSDLSVVTPQSISGNFSIFNHNEVLLELCDPFYWQIVSSAFIAISSCAHVYVRRLYIAR